MSISWRLRLLDFVLRVTEKPKLARMQEPEVLRHSLEHAAARLFKPVPGVNAVSERLPSGDGTQDVLWLSAPGAERGRIVLHFHGGIYIAGSPTTHKTLAEAIAIRTGARVALPDYRLAPENPFPAAVEDALAAWHGLLDAGYDPATIAVTGDSAGGGLAFALLHELTRTEAPRPACVAAFSPWVDLTLSGGSMTALAKRDALIPAHRAPDAVEFYLQGRDASDPRASPLFGTFTGAGPVLIQSSRAEVLRDDGIRMAERLTAQGIDTELDLWDGCPHVWQIFQGRVPEADAALDRAAAFIRTHIG
ncbi:MAG: alpha/beta hydrolase [Rubricella sp.]